MCKSHLRERKLRYKFSLAFWHGFEVVRSFLIIWRSKTGSIQTIFRAAQNCDARFRLRSAGFCPSPSRLPGGLPDAPEGNVLPFYLVIEIGNISLRLAVRAVRAFAAREIVLVVAVAAALASCALVPPDAGYAAYVDWHTLALLFCLMAVVVGFRSLGVLDAAGAWLIARARTQRAVAGVLVGLAFIASMAVTNDVALITFVPLALVVLRRAGMECRMCLVATLMTIAANLGSMFTPVGNPQNLYLFTVSGMGVGEFLQLMVPYTAASAAMLAIACVLCFRGGEVCGASSARFASSDGFASGNAAEDPASEALPACQMDAVGSASETSDARLANGHPSAGSTFESPSSGNFSACSRKRLAVYGALFACCLAAVPGVLDVRVLLALVLVGVSLSDASLLRRVDWGLLATFAALFVFVGNMGRVPVLHEALSAAVGGNALLAAVGGSQVISNVPAAVLLSGFTDQWQALIVGTNLGGLGTLIASMASLITFKAVMMGRPGIRGRYLLVFTAWNVAFLAALLALAAVLGAA